MVLLHKLTRAAEKMHHSSISDDQPTARPDHGLTEVFPKLPLCLSHQGYCGQSSFFGVLTFLKLWYLPVFRSLSHSVIAIAQGIIQCPNAHAIMRPRC